MRHSLRVANRPLRVRSRNMARSNPTNDPTICIHHAPGRRWGVDRFSEAEESGAGFFDHLQEGQHILERARQAVEFPDNLHIVLAQLIEQAAQFWTIPATSRHLLFNYPSASRRRPPPLRTALRVRTFFSKFCLIIVELCIEASSTSDLHAFVGVDTH